MHWTKIILAVSAAEVDDVEAQLWDLGAVAVTVMDASDNPIYEPPPGETPVWESILLEGLFEDDIELTHVSSSLIQSGCEIVATEEVADRLWEREWMTDFEPMRFGNRLWVCPTGFDVADAEATIIALDPGLAFGTGTHATTRLCLEWLDRVDMSGKRVLDFGCGSGVLGIAALLLGASEVVAIDNDPQALTATLENARRNNVAEKLATHIDAEGVEGEFDLVLANILAKPLIELAPLLASRLISGGDIVLSGILENQLSWVEEAYVDRVRLVGQEVGEGWVCLHGRK